jgi:predicted nuclease with TOPRIM domain
MSRITVTLSILSVALVVFCISLIEQTRRDTSMLAEAQSQVTAAKARYDRTVQEMSTIQDSLNSIAVDASGVMRISSLGNEQKLSPTGASEALARISELRERIQSLEAHLQRDDIRAASLDRMMKELKVSLAEKEQMVAMLGGRVDSLQTHVADLSSSVEQAHTLIAAQSDTLEQRRRELGTVYYAAGTKNELMKGGVVVARGGVLGMGKTLGPSNTADLTAFHEMDTDQESVIPLAGKKAQVLTAQPPKSYSIQSVNGRLELHILDAQAFRQVKRLVIVTA